MIMQFFVTGAHALIATEKVHPIRIITFDLDRKIQNKIHNIRIVF